MDTDFLLNFVEVVEYGSIAEVARKRSLTPAAINQRIRKVEDELGFRLLVRSGHTVTATPEATQILAQARRILDDLRMLKAASHGPMVFGRVSIGAFDSAMTTLIPKLMTKLIGRYPNLEISLVKGYSTNLYAKVQDGEVDAAVIVQPQFQLPKNLEWRRLRDEPLVVLAPAALTETDPNQLLRGNPLVCYDRKLWGGQLATNYFREHNIKPKIRIEAASIEVIALLVSQGLGVSLIPDWSGDLLHELPLRKVALAQSQYVRSVGLLWNCHSARADLIEQIYAMAVAPA